MFRILVDRWFWLLVVSAILFPVAGCGLISQEPVRVYADVTGKVTYKGEPLKMGNVRFEPASGAIATGTIEPDGTYSLKAEVGPNLVTIVSRDQDPSLSSDPVVQKKALPAKNHIPEIYGGAKSPLNFTVEDGANGADFDLK